MNQFISDNVRMQPNRYSCGPCALRHALLFFGERHSARKIAALAGTTKDGTGIDQLETAAKALGHRFVHRVFELPRSVRGVIRADCPVIVCVDAWTHWVTAVHATAKHVTIADSSRPGPVLQRLTWRDFFRRIAVWEEGVRFDLWVVSPR